MTVKPFSGSASDVSPTDESLIRLGQGVKGLRGVVVSVGNATDNASIEDDDLERRLLEIGFVEGAAVEILHEGWVGGDPIAVRLDDMRVALRRREANSILIRLDERRLSRP